MINKYRFRILLELFLQKKEVVTIVNKIKVFIEKSKKWFLKEWFIVLKEYNFFKEELREDLWLIDSPIEQMEEELFWFIDKIISLGNFLKHFSYSFYDWFCFANSYFYYIRTPGNTEMKFADLFFMERHGHFFGKNLKIFSDIQEKLVLVNRKDNPEEFNIEDIEDKKLIVKFSTEYVVSEDLWCKVSPSKIYVMIHEEDFFREELLKEYEKKEGEEKKGEIRLPEEVGGKKVIYMDNLYPQRDVPDSFLRHLFGRPYALLYFDTIADNMSNSLFNKSEKEAYKKKLKAEAIVEKTNRMIKKEKENYLKKRREEEQLKKEKKLTKKEKQDKEQLEKEKSMKKKEKEERLDKEKKIVKTEKRGGKKLKKNKPIDTAELQKKKLKEEELKKKKRS